MREGLPLPQTTRTGRDALEDVCRYRARPLPFTLMCVARKARTGRMAGSGQGEASPRRSQHYARMSSLRKPFGAPTGDLATTGDAGSWHRAGSDHRESIGHATTRDARGVTPRTMTYPEKPKTQFECESLDERDLRGFMP